jgi:hypothetical protein
VPHYRIQIIWRQRNTEILEAMAHLRERKASTAVSVKDRECISKPQFAHVAERLYFCYKSKRATPFHCRPYFNCRRSIQRPRLCLLHPERSLPGLHLHARN